MLYPSDKPNRNYLISSDCKSVFDLITPTDLNGPDMELVIFPQEKSYVLQPLKKPALQQEGWVRELAVYTAKDADDGVYMAFGFRSAKSDATRRIVLQHKDRFVGRDYKQLMQWDNIQPIALGMRCKPKRIIYMDSELIIFNDLQYWNLNTQEYGSLPNIPNTVNAWQFEKKSGPTKESSIILARENYYTGPITFSLFSLLDANTTDESRSRISLLASPDYQLIEIFDHIDGTDDWKICDSEFLDTPNRFLIGTMSGIYLCER